jgi:deferrochelatase/peroxidase EfeB
MGDEAPAPIDEKANRQRLASHARRLGVDTNGRGASVLRLGLSFSNGTTAR